tara:strand:+ start:199 stop:882 length:684 start_codon:yes stop_codon:yes gene_type:complete
MNPAEPTTFEILKEWAELLYFFSGLGLLIVAGFGLYQLKLAKEQIESAKKIFRKQSVRASFEAAVNECNRLSDRYFPLAVEFSAYIEEQKITFFDDAVIEELDEGFKVNLEKINKDDLEKLSHKSELIGKLANGIEGFALYIVSGVADDNIAFHTLGKVFVEEAERISKILPFTNAEQEDCKAIWALYFKWKARLEHQKLQVEKSEIDKRLAKSKVEKYTAIGTEKS